MAIANLQASYSGGNGCPIASVDGLTGIDYADGGDFSVSCWVMLRDLTSLTLLSLRATTGAGGIALGTVPNMTLVKYTDAGVATQYYGNNGILFPYQWQHHAWVFRANRLDRFLDGRILHYDQDVSASVAGSAGTRRCVVGQNYSPMHVADLRIFKSKALSPAQIFSISRGVGRLGGESGWYWPLTVGGVDGGNGRAYDFSENGNHLVHNGAAGNGTTSVQKIPDPGFLHPGKQPALSRWSLGKGTAEYFRVRYFNHHILRRSA